MSEPDLIVVPWGAMVAIPTDDAVCPWCGEEACERSCTGALLAEEDTP